MTPVPSLRTWVPGELCTAALANSQIRDPSDFHLDRPFIQVSDTADQSITNNTWTAVTWNSPVGADNEDMHPGSGSTLNIKRAGSYTIHGLALFAANGTGLRGVRLKRNGTVWVTSTTYTSYGAPTAGQGTLETALLASDPGIYCDVADTISMEVFQTSGGSLNLLRNYSTNIYSYLSVRWVAST